AELASLYSRLQHAVSRLPPTSAYAASVKAITDARAKALAVSHPPQVSAASTKKRTRQPNAIRLQPSNYYLALPLAARRQRSSYRTRH
ncbi:hypothetical protein HK100_009754, partial [Physocladia obscura]